MALCPIWPQQPCGLMAYPSSKHKMNCRCFASFGHVLIKGDEKEMIFSIVEYLGRRIWTNSMFGLEMAGEWCKEWWVVVVMMMMMMMMMLLLVVVVVVVGVGVVVGMIMVMMFGKEHQHFSCAGFLFLMLFDWFAGNLRCQSAGRFVESSISGGGGQDGT